MRTCVALALALLVSIPALVAAQTSPDVVRLRDGSWMRGTISERTSDEVVIVLATGEVRRIPASDVAFAGPEEPTILTPTDPTVPQHTVRVRGEAGLSLHAVVGTEMRTTVTPGLQSVSVQSPTGARGTALMTVSHVHSAPVDVHQAICTAPCERVLPESTYSFAIGHAGRDARTFERRFLVDRDLTLDLWHQDRSGWRALGWTLVVVGPLLAGGLILAADLTQPWPAGVDEPMLISGIVSGSVLLIVGAALAALSDGLDIRIVPDGPPPSPRSPRPTPRRRAAEPDEY